MYGFWIFNDFCCVSKHLCAQQRLVENTFFCHKNLPNVVISKTSLNSITCCNKRQITLGFFKYLLLWFPCSSRFYSWLFESFTRKSWKFLLSWKYMQKNIETKHLPVQNAELLNRGTIIENLFRHVTNICLRMIYHVKRRSADEAKLLEGRYETLFIFCVLWI